MCSIDRLVAEPSFQEVTFSSLEAQGINLSGKEFCRCTFQNVKFQESRWKRTHLEDCLFVDCDLTRLQPAGMNLLDVQFKRSKLMGIDWTDVAKNPVFSFEECDLRYVSFIRTNLRKAKLLKCNAVEATFFECDLVEADFSGTELTGANFEASDLCKANFIAAEGAFVNPGKNRVKNTRISVEGAVLLATHLGLRVADYSDALSPTQSKSSRGGRKR